MTELIRAVVLGLIQGLTEFLPVSSSGHLVIAKAVMAGRGGDVLAEPNAAWEVALHFATALATVVLFRREVWQLIRAFVIGAGLTVMLRSFKKAFALVPLYRTALLMGLACVPAGLVGLLLKDQLEALTGNPMGAAIMLLVTGAFLFATRWRRDPQSGGEVGLVGAVGMGLAQAVALLPGISRSGSTISTGMLLGVRAKAAARFSFIMVLPLILGATALEARKIESGAAGNVGWLLVGFLVAGVSGYAALRWLLRLTERGRLHHFAWYCWAVGLATIAWLLLR